MRSDRLTDEAETSSVSGMPFLDGRGFRLNLSVVTTDAVPSAVRAGVAGVQCLAPTALWQADPSQNLRGLSHPEPPELPVDAAAAVAGNTSLRNFNPTHESSQDLSGPGGHSVAQPTSSISGARIAGPHWLLVKQELYRVTTLSLPMAFRPCGQTVDVRGPAVTWSGRMGLLPDMQAAPRSARLGLIKSDGRAGGDAGDGFRGNGIVSSSRSFVRPGRIALSATKDERNIAFNSGVAKLSQT